MRIGDPLNVLADGSFCSNTDLAAGICLIPPPSPLAKSN